MWTPPGWQARVRTKNGIFGQVPSYVRRLDAARLGRRRTKPGTCSPKEESRPTPRCGSPLDAKGCTSAWAEMGAKPARGPLEGVRLENARLRITAHDAVTPRVGERLDRAIDALMPSIRITDLRWDVNSRIGFSDAFTDLRSGRVHSNRAAILAGETNLGLERMARASRCTPPRVQASPSPRTLRRGRRAGTACAQCAGSVATSSSAHCPIVARDTKRPSAYGAGAVDAPDGKSGRHR